VVAPDQKGLDAKLLSILVCPVDRGPLLLVDDVLYNPRLRTAYRIDDGIPVLLVDQAVDIGSDEHQRLMARAGCEEQ
jgi:uncharacterized protein YbaR (Trm112 family)